MQLGFETLRRRRETPEEVTLDQICQLGSVRPAGSTPATDAKPGGPAAPESRWEDEEILSCGQLIEEILELNPGAPLDFLGRFSSHELRNYLNHLRWLQQPRSGEARWIRPGDSPAVLARTRTF